ncbi:restriction endonuclease subunit S [Chryseobacterium rhizosphaerae]|uniref:Type I restriction modification DNA specificity domain-containing protein n=1 Tax=Chryseobacterium rhizosphaerae TaxID=395937 RepID=A0ABX9ILF2_9FLAO|nr:restriction endonuclease subunit S [Chryseobacterium rhizosphaerae]REC75905.1 hypothetical protein DRF57_09055 [Chryseobacterium rhizosphaerae]GEN67171.1 hypothetical protein CRH01_17390 [Chryseobacterium rhizosphaerae]
MDNTLYDIPDSWKWVTLNEVSITNSGGTPDRKNPSNFKGDIPWVKSGELNYNLIIHTEEYITLEALEFSNAKIFEKGSLLIALYGNTVGRMAFLGTDAATNQAVACIKTFVINSKYVYYYLMSAKDELLNKREGSAQPNISQKVLNDFPFPLSPIEEQDRIVEKIESILSELDKSNDDLLKSKELVDKLIKKTIFNLFKAISKRLPLSEVSQIIMGQSPNSKSYNYQGIGLPLFQGKKEFTNLFPIPEKWTTSPIRIAKENDILMSVRAPVGDVNIANTECSIGRGLCAIRFNGYYKFLFYYLDSIKHEISDLGTGSTFNSISKDIVSNILVPYPPKEIQFELINDLELKIINYKKILEDIGIQMTNNVSLRAKFLKEAFEGKQSERYDSDSTVKSTLLKIREEKSKYLITQADIIKNKPKFKKEEFNLIKFLKEKYYNTSFTFSEIYNDINMSRDFIVNEFRKLEEENKLNISIDKITNTVKYTLK